MPGIVKAEIDSDGEYYCARTLNIDVFTQGRTIDEAIENLKKAVSLHLEDGSDYGLQEVSSILGWWKPPYATVAAFSWSQRFISVSVDTPSCRARVRN